MHDVLPRRLPALDGLRGVAILMVILTHVVAGWATVTAVIGNLSGSSEPFNLPGWLRSVGEHCYLGVMLFFVVSAFTLTLSNRGNLSGYALRRIARVGPAFWLAGLLYTLLAGTDPAFWTRAHPSNFIIAALFAGVWQGDPVTLGIVPGGWSISCEVAFYVALPIMLYAFGGRVWRAALATGIAVVVAQVWARHLILHGQWSFIAYTHPLEQASVFLCGITAALTASSGRVPRLPGVALVLLALAVFGLPFLPVPQWWLEPHIPFAILSAMAVLFSAVSPPRVLASATMHRIGKVSYSMYLVHFALLAPSLTVAAWIVPAMDWRTLALHYAMTVGATFAIACATYRWVEQPCIQAAARLLRARAAYL